MGLPQHSGTGRSFTLVLACGVFLAAGVILAGLGPALPHLAAHVGQDIGALGWLFTALSSGVVLAQFGAGRAGDQLGQRPVLTAGMLLMSSGALGVTMGSSLFVLLAGALLAGIGFGGVLSAGNRLVAQLFPTRSATALNGLNLFYGVGSMLGPAVASLAGTRLGAPQAALWLGGGLLLVLAPTVFNRATARPPIQTDVIRSTLSPARPLALWLLGLMMLVYTGTEVGFGGWVTVYLMSSAALAPASAALVAAGFWMALTVGRALGAILGLRLAPQKLLAVSLLGILGGALLLITSVGVFERSVAGVLLLGLSCGPVFPTILALVSAARTSSATISMVLTLGNSGGLVIPALFGLLLSRLGPPAMAAMVLTAALAMVLLGVVAVRTAVVEARTRSIRAIADEC